MKEKLEEKKFFIITNDTFKVDVAFFINYSFEEAIKGLKSKKYSVLKEYLMEHNGEGILENANLGRMFILKQGYAVFLKFPKNSYRKNVALLSHEISHVVSFLLMDRRIKLSEDTDEVYAYLTEELMFKFLNEWY